jgi:hypothetical protein
MKVYLHRESVERSFFTYRLYIHIYIAMRYDLKYAVRNVISSEVNFVYITESNVLLIVKIRSFITIEKKFTLTSHVEIAALRRNAK